MMVREPINGSANPRTIMKNPLVHLRVRHLLATLVLSVAFLPSAVAGTAFSKVVVFGDSLNDRGNMYQFTAGAFPAPPLYAVGRQSNGPVWVEYFAKRLSLSGQIDNYAVVGALTAAAPGYPTGNVWSVQESPGAPTFAGLEGTDVASQIGDYLEAGGGQADSAALFILAGGANDFPRVANPAVIVANLVQSYVRLQLAGARHIVVMNLPDIGKTPRVILAEKFGLLPPGYTAKTFSDACALLNQALAAELQLWTLTGVTLTVADTYGFMNRVSANPASFGFVTVDLPYLLAGNGTDASKWLFWDDLHPTTRGHEVFAEHVVESLVRRYSPGQGNIGKGAINGLNGLVKAPGR